MQITTNNMNNNNDNKCYYHDQELKFLCNDCDNMPSCVDCITDDQYHRGHAINKIDSNSVSQLLIEFQNNLNPLITDYIKENKLILSESNRIFNQENEKYNTNLQELKQQIQQITTHITKVENDLKSSLLINHKHNLEIKQNLVSQFENQLNTLENIQSIQNNKNQRSHLNQTTITKHFQQSKIILSNSNPISSSPTSSSSSSSFGYKEIKQFAFNRNEFDKIKESLDKIINNNIATTNNITTTTTKTTTKNNNNNNNKPIPQWLWEKKDSSISVAYENSVNLEIERGYQEFLLNPLLKLYSLDKLKCYIDFKLMKQTRYNDEYFISKVTRELR